MATNPAQRRYLRRTIPITIAYLAGVFLAVGLVEDRTSVSVGVVALALLPGAAALGWIWALARLLMELDDEYLRMLEVRKFLVATAVVLAMSSIWGLLEMFTSVPRVPIFYIFPLWCFGLIFGQLFNRVTADDGGNT